VRGESRTSKISDCFGFLLMIFLCYCVLYCSAENHEGEYPVKVEISPLLSYDGEVRYFWLLLASTKQILIVRSPN